MLYICNTLYETRNVSYIIYVIYNVSYACNILYITYILHIHINYNYYVLEGWQHINSDIRCKE